MKKNTFKRILSAAVSMLMVAGSLSGCGAKQPAASAPAPAVSENTSTTPAGSDPYANSPTVKWRISNSQAPDHFYQKSYEKFADYVSEKSGGKFTIEVFHSATLGNEQEVVENMQAGNIAGTLGAGSLIANFVPAYDLFSLPGLFKDSEQLEQVMQDEAVMGRIKEESEKVGFYNYGYFQKFFRGLFTNKEIKSVSDLTGQKIRVMGSDIIVNTFQELGCNPTTTAWSELYSALQLGVCDGLDHVASSVQSMAFYENLKYVCEPMLFTSPMFVLFSKPMYDDLTPEYQALVDEAINTVLIPELQMAAETVNEEALNFLTTEGGMTYVECDVAAMQATIAPVRDKYINEMEDWVGQIAKDIIAQQ